MLFTSREVGDLVSPSKFSLPPHDQEAPHLSDERIHFHQKDGQRCPKHAKRYKKKNDGRSFEDTMLLRRKFGSPDERLRQQK